MSFVQRVLKSRNNIWLIVAPVKGDQIAWFFIRIEAVKANRFREDVFSRGVDLSEYGEILARGFGETPPAHVVARMEKDYAFQPQD
jgi:hypothetical protein